MPQTTKPSAQEMLNAALTVLRLGGVDTRGLVSVAEPLQERPVVKSKTDRSVWTQSTQPGAHIFADSWKAVTSTCPRCGFKGKVNPYFGMRVSRGIERKQSWCAECRNTANYHDKPRTRPYKPRG